MTEDESRMLEAGVNAISLSRLARWIVLPKPAFEANEEEEFEKSLAHHELGLYGRWLRWSWFAIGAETLAKAACLANADRCPAFKDLGKCQKYYLPKEELVESNLAEWAKAYRNNGKAHRFQQNVNIRTYLNYGQLGDYWQKHLPKLGEACHLSFEEIDKLCAGYRLLSTAVRNRDVHNYVLGVRQENFYLIRTVFVPCLNVLLQTFPRGDLTNIEVPRINDPT